MSPDDQPQWLATAIAGRTTRSMPTVSAEIQVGQIRRLDPMDFGAAESRLALVIGVDKAYAVATVMVVSPEVEMGTDIDRLVPSAITGLQFDLVALSDVAGPAWFVQLGNVVANLTVDLVELTGAGIAIRDDKDARWVWKESELDALVKLTAECRYQLVEGEPATVADPVAFNLEMVDVKGRSQIALAVVQLLHQDRVFLPAEAFAASATPDNTSRAFESFTVLGKVISRHRDRVLPTSHRTPNDPSLPRGIKDDPLASILESLAERLDDSVRCIRVASLSSLWPTEFFDSSQYLEVVLGGRRHQVVVCEVDLTEVCDV